MWLEETVRNLAAWLDLRPGMTAVDVGCGLGYLGQTYWRHFGGEGRYFGVDIAPKLLAEGARGVTGGRACFIGGSAYALPLPEDFADCVMCQALLVHLEDPERALAEMVRVAKPGGLVLCQELDEVSGLLTRGYESLPQLDFEEEVILTKGLLRYHRGRIKLGRGDFSFASRVPVTMKALGLTDIGVRVNDLPYYAIPPYDDEIQYDQFEKAKRIYFDEEAYQMWRRGEREAFFAAGGSPQEYDEYRKLIDKRTALTREQLRSGRYSTCKVSHFYVSKGRKPAGEVGGSKGPNRQEES
jgi:SAM-dependent methyltransferase